MALGQTDNWAQAATQLEAAVASVPDSDEMNFDLATAYERLGRIPEALKAYGAALQLNPDHFQANLMLGRLLGVNQEPAAALPFLQRAVKLQPDSADAHKFLANVYTLLGQEENARREQAELQRLQRAF